MAYGNMAPGYNVGGDEVESYIRQAAQQRGIDPNVALTVYKREGASGWQSQVRKNGVQEPSYGPFQLYTGGGLGNEFQRDTGLDPRDPNTWKQNVDYALDSARKGGWGPWYGAKAAGITGKMGIGGNSFAAEEQPPAGLPSEITRGYSAGVTPPPQNLEPFLRPDQQRGPDLEGGLQKFWTGLMVASGNPQGAAVLASMRGKQGDRKVVKGDDGSFYEYDEGSRQFRRLSGATKPDKGQEAYDKANAERFVGMNEAIAKDAAAARGRIGELNTLEGLLSNPHVLKGALAEEGLYLKKLGSQLFGLNFEGVSDAEAARTISNKLALELRNPSGGAGMPGALSDKDLSFLRASVPGLENTEDGNRKIIDYHRRLAQRSVEVERLRQQYVQQRGRLDEGFSRVLSDYADKNPLFANEQSTLPKGVKSIQIVQ